MLLTLAATLFASWAWGFTLNRVSLFALIFSIGILVDDAIVVVENIHRHRVLDPDAPLATLIPRAVDEVGGPTILATFTVIAALLPMAFVTGLMGPYMSPIPINASMGMVISLAVAFVITPWLALKLTPQHAHAGHAESRLDRWLASTFARLLTPFVDAGRGGRRRKWLGVGIVVAILASVSLALVQLVVLKMLPFDNKSEFQVIVDMPAGAPVEATAAALSDLGAHVATARRGDRLPGLRGHGVADQFQRPRPPVRVAADAGAGRPAGQPRRPQAPLAQEPRDRGSPCARRSKRSARSTTRRSRSSRCRRGRRCSRRSSPRSTGRTRRGGTRSPRACAGRSARPTGVIGIDDSIEDNAPRALVRVDQRKAALAGVTVADIVAALRVGLAGDDVTALRDGQAKYGVPVRLTIPPEQQGRLDTLLAMTVRSDAGAGVPLSELVARPAGAAGEDASTTRTCCR